MSKPSEEASAAARAMNAARNKKLTPERRLEISRSGTAALQKKWRKIMAARAKKSK